MNIIRDGEHGSIFMHALLIDWGIRRCNEEGCTNMPNTIIGGAGKDIPVFGLCEEHYQMCNQKNGGATLHLEFDGFDAFKACQEEETP